MQFQIIEELNDSWVFAFQTAFVHQQAKQKYQGMFENQSPVTRQVRETGLNIRAHANSDVAAGEGSVSK